MRGAQAGRPATASPARCCVVTSGVSCAARKPGVRRQPSCGWTDVEHLKRMRTRRAAPTCCHVVISSVSSSVPNPPGMVTKASACEGKQAGHRAVHTREGRGAATYRMIGASRAFQAEAVDSSCPAPLPPPPAPPRQTPGGRNVGAAHNLAGSTAPAPTSPRTNAGRSCRPALPALQTSAAQQVRLRSCASAAPTPPLLPKQRPRTSSNIIALRSCIVFTTRISPTVVPLI